MQSIILGSNSITRAELLDSFGVKFTQKGTSFDEESLDIQNPSHFVYRATVGKMNSFVEEFGLETPVLCADTVVTSQGKLLRKAKDKDDARRMLNLQSNNEVSIITCMIFKSLDTEIFDISTTMYHFTEFDRNDLENYIQSGECMGKAGAIMVEGFCKPYIKEVVGYESTAMGLCIEKLLPYIK